MLAIAGLALRLEIQRWELISAFLKLLPDGKVHDGKLVEERRVARLGVERTLRKAQLHHGPDLVAVSSLAIVLLNDLEEASVVDVAVLLELTDLIGNLVELRLQSAQAGSRDLSLLGSSVLLRGLHGRQFLQLVKGRVDSLFESIEALFLEVCNLLKLVVKNLLAETSLVLLSPWLAIVIGILPQQALELGVLNVLILPRRVYGLAECPTETHVGYKTAEVSQPEGGPIAFISGDQMDATWCK